MKVIFESESGLNISSPIKRIGIRDAEYRYNKKLYIFDAPMSHKEYALILIAMAFGKKFENYVLNIDTN